MVSLKQFMVQPYKKYYGVVQTIQTYIRSMQTYMTTFFLNEYVRNRNSGCFGESN